MCTTLRSYGSRLLQYVCGASREISSLIFFIGLKEKVTPLPTGVLVAQEWWRTQVIQFWLSPQCPPNNCWGSTHERCIPQGFKVMG